MKIFKNKSKYKFADVSEINEIISSKNSAVEIILSQNLRLNSDMRQSKRNQNILLLGCAGSGKDQQFIKPNIEQCNHNMVIVDVSNNLHQQCNEILTAHGYGIILCDFDSIDATTIKEIAGKLINNPKCAVFLNLKYETMFIKNDYGILIDELYQNLFHLLRKSEWNKYDNMQHIQIYLNEFQCIPYIPNLDKYLMFQSSYHIGTTICIQSLHQMRAIYKQYTDMLLNCCDTIVFLGGHSYEELEFLFQLQPYDFIKVRDFVHFDMSAEECLIFIKNLGLCKDKKI